MKFNFHMHLSAIVDNIDISLQLNIPFVLSLFRIKKKCLLFLKSISAYQEVRLVSEKDVCYYQNGY